MKKVMAARLYVHPDFAHLLKSKAYSTGETLIPFTKKLAEDSKHNEKKEKYHEWAFKI